VAVHARRRMASPARVRPSIAFAHNGNGPSAPPLTGITRSTVAAPSRIDVALLEVAVKLGCALRVAGWITMVSGALAPTARLPTTQLSVWPTCVQPGLLEAVTSARPAGSCVVTTTDERFAVPG